MNTNVKAADALIKKAAAETKELLEQYPEMALYVGLKLNAVSNYLAGKGGEEVAEAAAVGVTTITKLRGQAFKQGEEVVVETKAEKIVSAEDNALAELNAEVDKLAPSFMTTNEGKLLDESSDLVLRVFAKRAGLPVTESSPKKITVDYIKQIKAAMEKQNELPL